MPLTLELSKTGHAFLVELPSGHHIVVPQSEGGVAILRRLLLAQKAEEVQAAMRRVQEEEASRGRAQAEHFFVFGVGTEVSPTQRQIDAWLEGKAKEPSIPKPPAKPKPAPWSDSDAQRLAAALGL